MEYRLVGMLSQMWTRGVLNEYGLVGMLSQMGREEF